VQKKQDPREEHQPEHVESMIVWIQVPPALRSRLECAGTRIFRKLLWHPSVVSH
jgi:hypothetical protein